MCTSSRGGEHPGSPHSSALPLACQEHVLDLAVIVALGYGRARVGSLTTADSSRSSDRLGVPEAAVMRLASVTRIRGIYGGPWTLHLRRAQISLLGHIGARFS